jgi:hypothetical protein
MKSQEALLFYLASREGKRPNVFGSKSKDKRACERRNKRPSLLFGVRGEEQGPSLLCVVQEEKEKEKENKTMFWSVQMVQKASGWSKRTKAKKQVGVLQVAVRGNQDTKD